MSHFQSGDFVILAGRRDGQPELARVVAVERGVPLVREVSGTGHELVGAVIPVSHGRTVTLVTEMTPQLQVRIAACRSACDEQGRIPRMRGAADRAVDALLALAAESFALDLTAPCGALLQVA